MVNSSHINLVRCVVSSDVRALTRHIMQIVSGDSIKFFSQSSIVQEYFPLQQADHSPSDEGELVVVNLDLSASIEGDCIAAICDLGTELLSCVSCAQGDTILTHRHVNHVLRIITLLTRLPPSALNHALGPHANNRHVSADLERLPPVWRK